MTKRRVDAIREDLEDYSTSDELAIDSRPGKASILSVEELLSLLDAWDDLATIVARI